MDLKFPLHSAFVAIPLEGDAKLAFQALRFRLAAHEDILSLQKEDTPHLTLYFWRSLMKIEYDEVVRLLGNVAGRSTPFDLPVRGVETFGDKKGDKVLCLTPVFSPQLADLKKRCPWPNEPDKPFHPHVTIARVRHPGKFAVHKKKILKLLGDVDFSIRADRIRLYANVGGVNQTPLQEFVFPGR